jgi:hypothetical protein
MFDGDHSCITSQLKDGDVLDCRLSDLAGPDPRTRGVDQNAARLVVADLIGSRKLKMAMASVFRDRP